MIDFPDELTIILVIYCMVFALNVLPALAPPTWMTLSFVGLAIPGGNAVAVAIVGATAATLGRLALSKLARVIVRQRLLSEAARHNIHAIKHEIEDRKALTATMFMGFALSPLPSNYLFIAYGLTSLRMQLVGIPFFFGRLLSYGFWVTTASALGDRLDLDPLESTSYFGIYFLLSQLLLVPAMYAFTRMDWHAAFTQRKFRLLRKFN
jgi:hypothetical protein